MKILKIVTFTLITNLILGMGSTVAQAPDMEWQKSLGGSGEDIAYSIQQTDDGGYIIAGFSSSNNGDVSGNHGDTDYWVVKTSSLGNIEWQKSFGGTATDTGYGIQQTTDGGYIIAGASYSNDGDVSGNNGIYDYWVLKLNDVGEMVWQKTFGGSGQDIARSVQQTTDNGYVIAGMSNSIDGDVTGNHGDYDYWIVKLSEAGNIQWQKSYGGSASDFAYSIQQIGDGGYIVAGGSYSNDGDVAGNHGNGDYWIVKLNATGNIQWQKPLGGTNWEAATTVQQTMDGGYIVTGESGSTDGDVTGNQGSYDFWTVKLTDSGIIEWQQSHGGSGIDSANSLQQTMDGGYIVAGYSGSTDGDVTGNQGNADFWIVKLTDTGTMVWQKSLGGPDNDVANSIKQTTDGGFIIAGYSDSNAGDVTGNHGGADYWIVKLGPDPLALNEFNHQITLYPNPVSTILNITANEPVKTVTVFNPLGQEVMTSSYFETKLQLDMSGLPPNVYLVVIATDNFRQTFKIAVR